MKYNFCVSGEAKYAFCVSGAAETEPCSDKALDLAKELGKEIVRQEGVLITGATTGTPYWAAIGAKEEKGLSIGFSPAVSRAEHVRSYKLPTDYFDFIVYTGFNYSGRNLILTRASDAVFFVCGRMGTLNEFTIAFEDNKPIGILEGSGGFTDYVRDIITNMKRGEGRVVYSHDPRELVQKVRRLVDEDKKINHEL